MDNEEAQSKKRLVFGEDTKESVEVEEDRFDPSLNH